MLRSAAWRHVQGLFVADMILLMLQLRL